MVMVFAVPSPGTLIGGALILYLIAANAKSLPLVYTIRLLPSLYRLLRPRLFARPRPSRVLDMSLTSTVAAHPTLFKHHVTSSRAVLMDLDPNMHKSNSTFFVDADINRAALLTHLLSPVLVAVGSSSAPGMLVLAAVQCRFRGEIRPFQAYDISSRILAWDDKSLFVITYFLRRGTKLPAHEVEGGPDALSRDAVRKRDVYAILVSRYVCKAARVTISPRSLLLAASLLSPVEGSASGKPGCVGDLTANGRVDKAVENGLRYLRECMV